MHILLSLNLQKGSLTYKGHALSIPGTFYHDLTTFPIKRKYVSAIHERGEQLSGLRHGAITNTHFFQLYIISKNVKFDHNAVDLVIEMIVIYTYYGTCMTYLYTTKKRYIFWIHKLKDTDLCRNCLPVYSLKSWKIMCHRSVASVRNTNTNSHNSFCWSKDYRIVKRSWMNIKQYNNKF